MRVQALAVPRSTPEILVQEVVSEVDLMQVRQVRAQAYGHHLGDVAGAFAEHDPMDAQPGSVVWLCRDAASGEALGTVRLRRALSDEGLQLEQSLALPEAVRTAGRAEATRLAVLPGASPLVKLALMRAVHRYCLAHGLRWLVIGARSEALVRQYRQLGFTDLLGAGRTVPLRHAGGLPHHVLILDVTGIQETWRRRQHRFYDFMFAATDLPNLPWPRRDRPHWPTPDRSAG